MTAVVLLFSLTSMTVLADEEKKTYLIGFHNQLDVNEFIEEDVTNTNGVQLYTSEDKSAQVQLEVLHEFEQIPVVAVELSPADIKALEAESGIAYIEEDFDVTIANQTVPWGIAQVQAPQAHELGHSGSGTKVAVLDTGIAEHADLFIHGGASFVAGEPDYHDLNGHGTHVAGTIAALNDGAGVIGVAPDAELYAVKVLGASGSGSVSSIAQGLEWAGDNGMDVANLSLGSPVGSDTLEQAVNYATDSGVLVVAASGNSGSGTVSYPARYDNAFAVGATDQVNNRASFSQYGTGLDIVAPGVEVESTYLNGEYASLSGTSMATPHVAGVAALIKAKNPMLSNEEIRQQLVQTATPLGSADMYGSGLVNAEVAVQ
ncbi:peptidase S8 [Alkalihalobacillus pseudalcaliphilus]|nr:peptidase S8 [Alkalihalobacillus pseudalcaliphilus]